MEMAFRGESVEESMRALITAIHYPNKHKTQPFAGYKFRDIRCLQETKACDPAHVNLQIKVCEPIPSGGSFGDTIAGINPPMQAVNYYS